MSGIVIYSLFTFSVFYDWKCSELLCIIALLLPSIFKRVDFANWLNEFFINKKKLCVID